MIKVLMAEDDVLLLHIYEKIFRAKEYEITFTKDGEETLSKLRKMEIKPDIILLDIMMPKKSGFEVIKEVKEDQKLKDIPIIFLTNVYGEQEEQEGLKLGASAYLIKSNHVPSEIIDIVKDIYKKYYNK